MQNFGLLAGKLCFGALQRGKTSERISRDAIIISVFMIAKADEKLLQVLLA